MDAKMKLQAKTLVDKDKTQTDCIVLKQTNNFVLCGLTGESPIIPPRTAFDATNSALQRTGRMPPNLIMKVELTYTLVPGETDDVAWSKAANKWNWKTDSSGTRVKKSVDTDAEMVWKQAEPGQVDVAVPPQDVRLVACQNGE
jgi:hypothetical protein